MQTRKDLYQAHRLMTQRVALALLQGKPGAAESPLRRTGVGAFCGVMVAVLVAAGFGIAGLVFKGGARNLEKPGLVLIEKETGAVYAYSSQDRRLVPFLNYASARLAMPTSSIERKMVSSKSLARYARGPMTGIQGAPESLPIPGKLTKAPWSVCVRNPGGGSVVSLIGGRDVGGRALSNGHAVLVQAGPQGWLIWRDTRMRISPGAARVLTADQPAPVDQRWLNALPQGPDFAAPHVPDWGRPTPGPDGTPAPIGQIFRVAPIAGTPARWYVQLVDGLSGVSQTQARLLLDRPGSAPPRDIPPAAAGARPSRTNLYNPNLPENPPRIAAYRANEALCAVYRNTGKLSTEARFTIGGSLPASAAAPTSQELDQVVMPGGGTFSGTLSQPGQKPQAFSLITEQGVRHPIATPDDVVKLGYSVTTAVPVPANLIQLFRTGPILTSAAAVRPVPATGPHDQQPS